MAVDTALAKAYETGLKAEKSGDFADAKQHYLECLRLDPSDMCGASVRLASLGQGETPHKAPDAYVATLFDQIADDFDDILTGQLGYAVPMMLAEWIAKHAPGPHERMVDLGCGTGLSGMTLMPFCTHATGVDLSERMVELADERAAYDELFVNEAVHFLQEYSRSDDPAHKPFDLLVATDVLPYLGDLEPLFKGLRDNMAPGGALLCVSCETLPDDMFQARGWSITPHQRFAHSAAYVRDLCTEHGFSDILAFDDIVVRHESGRPIAGYLVIARSEA